MVSPENENCLVVHAVRDTLRKKMGRVETEEQNYGLLDLAYGQFSRSSYTVYPTGPGEFSTREENYFLSRREFMEDFFAGPHQVYGYSYEIELARTNKTIGVLVGAKGHRDDPLAEYCLVQLANGTLFEFEQLKEPETSHGKVFTGNKLGHTRIAYNGSVLGECRVRDYRKFLGLGCESEWDLVLKGESFGKIISPVAVGWNNLHITRPDGARLPLILAFHVGFADSLKAMWHVLTLRAFRGRPWPNPDWIVPPGVRPHLTSEETAFYFAISLLFRVYYGLDDRSGYCNG